MASDSRKGREIDGQARAMIARVYRFLREEYDFMRENNLDKCDLSPLANVRRRAAAATGVSERTVTKVLKEERERAVGSPAEPAPKGRPKEKTQAGAKRKRQMTNGTNAHEASSRDQWSYDATTADQVASDSSTFTRHLLPVQS